MYLWINFDLWLGENSKNFWNNPLYYVFIWSDILRVDYKIKILISLENVICHVLQHQIFGQDLIHVKIK